MNSFLAFIANSPEVTVFAVAIWFASFYYYQMWYEPALASVTFGVYRITSALAAEGDTWAEARDRVRQVLPSYPHLAAVWRETEQRVFDCRANGQNLPVMFGAPKDLWNPPDLMAKRFNFALAEAVPNILVGVGLFFTFVFLSWALVSTTAALTDNQSSAQETQEAISHLLQVAGGKFLTSLAGLSASILWTFYSKRALSRLGTACDDLTATLGIRISPNGSEEFMCRQFELTGDGVALTEELLNEAREQTGTFKRFETDLAITLAGAIKTSFGPQMEAMTEKLVEAIDRLSEKMGSMNQDALKKMMDDFASMLKQTTDSEMTQLRTTLVELATRLEGAGGVLDAGAASAAGALEQAGLALVTRVQEISQNLAVSATNLEKAADSIKIAMNDLEVTVLEAAEVGKKGTGFVDGALQKAGDAVRELSAASTGLGATANALQSLGGKLFATVEGVEELTQGQRAVVEAVREVTPAALAAAERVTEVLNRAAVQTREVMDETKRSMDATAAALTKTVGSITGGVTSYSEQVAKLHREMDNQLGKAVGSFDKGVSELQDAVEELAEVMREGKEV